MHGEETMLWLEASSCSVSEAVLPSLMETRHILKHPLCICSQMQCQTISAIFQEIWRAAVSTMISQHPSKRGVRRTPPNPQSKWFDRWAMDAVAMPGGWLLGPHQTGPIFRIQRTSCHGVADNFPTFENMGESQIVSDSSCNRFGWHKLIQ